MKITSFTLLLLTISILFIAYTIYRLRADKIGILSAIIWVILWLGIGFFGLFPNLLDPLMQLAQMKNRMFFILLVAVMVLFMLIFNLSSKMDRMQRTSAKLIQELSLLKNHIEKKGNAAKD